MNEAERRARLIQWLETVFADVQDLLVDNHVFWELQAIVSANPRFVGTPGLFTQWMASSFIQATSVGVRRQAKPRDSVSLTRFLLEVLAYPTLVSRVHYMSLYAGRDPRLIEMGEAEFDNLAGAGRPVLPPALVQHHLDELSRDLAGIEHYVDRRVAHYDPRGLARPTPTFADLTNALQSLERIVLLYWRLLKGQSMETMLPMFQYEWRDIFTFPWRASKADSGETM